MDKIGFYTGQIYRDPNESPKECCLNLNPEDPVFDNEEIMLKKRIELKKNCEDCFGCEESQKGLLNGRSKTEPNSHSC